MHSPNRRPHPKASKKRRFSHWLGLGKDGGKTNLDLLQLLVALSIPIVVVGMGSLFTYCQSSNQQQAEEQRANSQHAAEEQRAKAQLDVEEQRAQDEALQSYFDEVGALLLQHDDNKAGPVARARTLTILTRIGDVPGPARPHPPGSAGSTTAQRKRAVVQFLYESELIRRDQTITSIYVSLVDADLSGVNLLRSNLSGANLSGANLSGALMGSGTNLSGANLSGADLTGAKLSTTTTGAGQKAGQPIADLSNADLSDARFGGADLRGANLSGATGVDPEALEATAYSLNGTTMPDGSKHR
jgi:uncharacterized protein YjbI with pentapeptide repeats